VVGKLLLKSNCDTLLPLLLKETSYFESVTHFPCNGSDTGKMGASAKPKQEPNSAKKKERERSKSTERERKKREFALFPPLTEIIRS
jgi:hypothetical protein